MAWYKMWVVVPGTDGDAENGPCEPKWWNDMVQASSEEEAIQKVADRIRIQWEQPYLCWPGVEAPSDKEMGCACPVCTGAVAVIEEEYAAWEKEMTKEAFDYDI